MIETESCLRNLYTTYIFRNGPGNAKLSYIDKMRWLGGMEALLQVLGIIPSLVLWNYQSVKRKFLFVPYNSKETYDEYILRITFEFLKNSPNTPPTTFK